MLSLRRFVANSMGRNSSQITCMFRTDARQWRTEGVGGWGVQPLPPPKFQRPSKIVSNSTPLWKPLKIAEFRMPTHQDVRKKGSKILKLPPVRICFTLAKTNKLVVIINSLKVPKITKMLLYEIKFLVPNYSCLQNPWLGGYRPPDPLFSVLCPQLNLLTPPRPEQNSCVRHFLKLRIMVCNLAKESRFQLQQNLGVMYGFQE